MVTPKKYQEFLKNRIITMDMLSDSIYSVSKRAKHHRDMEQQYIQNERWKQSMNRYYYDKYDNAGQSAKRKEHFYRQKDIMLELLKPTSIHTSTHYMEETIYEYDYEYMDMKDSPSVIEKGKERMYRFEGEISYFDRNLREYITEYQVRYISADDTRRLDRAYYLFDDEPVLEKVNYIVVRVPRSYDIYLYYECGNHSFHKPVRMGIEFESDFERILDEVMKTYPELAVMEIPDLFIPSSELRDILSIQFTDKVVALIESGDYAFQRTA